MDRTSELSESPSASCDDPGPYSPGLWLREHGERARHAPAAAAERCKRLVLRAWSALTGMKLTEGLAAIENLEAEHASGSPEATRLDRALLQAAAVALNDDAERAALLAGNAAAQHAGGVGQHPATGLLLRLGHWKARRLDAFYELSRSASRHPCRRREARWTILHLSIESAVEAEQLRLVSAGRLANEALELAARFHGAGFSGARLAATLSARVLYEQNQVDAADRLLRDRMVLSGSHGGVEGALSAYVVGARIAAARRQLPFAVLLLREAELLGEERRWPRLVATSLAERARLFIEDGRLDEADACVQRLASMAATPRVSANELWIARCLAIARGRLELATGASARTATALRQLASESLLRRECHLGVELLMLLACTLHRLGREEDAAAQAMHALKLGATAGLYRTFLDGGEATRHLLDWLYERRVADTGVLGELRPYVRSLLVGFPERTDRANGARSKHRSGESLSPRERHIVTLMSHGLSNKRIARQLGIAPETVKSHAKHILLKLAAQTRVEAVSRALSLGII